jgi:hypothetical protein
LLDVLAAVHQIANHAHCLIVNARVFRAQHLHNKQKSTTSMSVRASTSGFTSLQTTAKWPFECSLSFEPHTQNAQIENCWSTLLRPKLLTPGITTQQTHHVAAKTDKQGSTRHHNTPQ